MIGFFRFGLICIFFPFFSLLALPVELKEDWEISPHWSTEGKEDWTPLSELPIREAVAKLSLDPDSLQKISLRKQFVLNEEDFLSASADSFALHIPFASNVFQIYFNSELLATQGKIENGDISESGYRRHLILKIRRDLVKVGNNQILIQIAASPGEELALYPVMNDESIRLDTFENLNNINEEYFTYMLIFLYFFVGIYHGLFFIKRPEEAYNLYYALFSVFLSVYLFFRSQASYLLDWDPYLQTRFEYFFVFLVPAWLLFFLESFFRGRFGKGTRAFAVFVGTISILQIFVSRSVSMKILMLWQFSVLIFAGYTIYVMIQAVRSKNQDAYRMVLGFGILVFAGIWDTLGATGLLKIQNLNLLRFGFLFFVLGIAVILANRFLRVHKEVETLNATLEKKVEERTNELKQSLVQVQELKVQQDGDYFLTSLLLDPLGATRQNSDVVSWESFTKQKKEFEFKKKKKEIGGDIIITDRIELDGRKYSVFINGDAMGKSMQGAGGALVLGVVFQSVIKRTQLKSDSRMKSPERWIKECFLELQSIFEGFQGSMLVSVALGLIEEDTGVLYYLNAEHPWTVLYRDGVASFIEDQLELRKIGTTGIEGDIRIRVFPLEAGDVLIIGSDGRDDLVIGEDSSGGRVMNEDETQFLRRVEDAKGILRDLVEGLKKFGDISDDLTLLRVEWKGTPPKLTRKDYPEWREGRELFLGKKYGEALSKLEIVMKHFPLDNEILLLLSYCYRKTNNINKAIDLGERLRLREPNHFRNLVHLANCYRILGVREKALKLLSKADQLYPNHPQILKVKEGLGGVVSG